MRKFQAAIILLLLSLPVFPQFTVTFKGLYEQVMLDINKGSYDQAGILIGKAHPVTQADSGLYLLARGYLYYARQQPDSAERCYLGAIRLLRQKHCTQELANAYNDLGNVLLEKNKLSEALDYFLDCIRLFEEARDTAAASGALHNIGLIYMKQNDAARGDQYTRKAITYNLRSKNYRWLSKNYLQLANFFTIRQNKDSALRYAGLSYELALKYGDPRSVAFGMQQLGITHAEFGDLKKARPFFDSALALRIRIKDSAEIIASYGVLGELMQMQGNSAEARRYLQKALAIATRKNILKYISECSRTLYRLCETEGDYKGAFENYKLYRQCEDSMHNEKLTRMLLDKEYAFNFEQKETLLKADNEKKVIRSEEEKKKQRIILYAVSVALALSALVGLLMFRSARLRKRANAELSLKNHLIEQKQKEILDSIHYAKRIQHALVTNEKYIERVLNKLNPQK